MQLSYHTYILRDPATAKRWRVDLRSFLAEYIQWNNAKFKNGFLHGGESVFLWALASVLAAPSAHQLSWMVLATAGALGMTLLCCLPLLILQLRALKDA